MTGIPGWITCAAASIAKISAADKRTTPGTVIGAVAPAPGRLQACRGMPLRAHFNIISKSIHLNSSGVREQAIKLASQSGNEQNLYLAKGTFYGMNGNYAAGMLEGIAKYHPDSVEWMSLTTSGACIE